MQRKLNTLFVLVSLSLLGIIIFQVYWSLSAYKANKEKFDGKIDMAMQKAMDDCKKDYFDSIRVVLVKRLSDTGTKIRIDTGHEADTAVTQLKIWVSNKYTGFGPNDPFMIIKPRLEFYRKKIPHRSTLPEVLAETSFYVPNLLEKLEMILGFQDLASHPISIKQFLTKNKKGEAVISTHINEYGIFSVPPNVRAADSIKLDRYFKTELEKDHINSNYRLHFSDASTPPQKPNMHYSETGEYSYKYHGFVFLKIVGPEYFARAVFSNPQYSVLKGMLIPLCLAVLLIFFTIYCFNYIIRLVIHQKKLAELKDDFINNMTHELKTPIATITVAIEGLQKFNVLDDPEKTQRYLQTSRTELSRLNDLVTKVLNIAAFEKTDIELVKEKILVDELVNDIITAEKAKARKTIEISYSNKDVSFIYADKLHFRNVLVNIIDNAVKYSNDAVSIAINCFKQGDDAVFSIKDNGIGIPAAHIGQIFDKFHRVPTGNVHNVKGTGLGLSYVKYIVEAHGGYISVKSEINTGSEFIVSIPLKNG